MIKIRWGNSFFIIFGILLLISFGCIENNGGGSGSSTVNNTNSSIIKIIEISNSSFKGYPSVWFSPSTGEITPVENGEIPPASKYAFWIEPGDPEFSISELYNENDLEYYGIKYLGNGSKFFENTTSPPSGKFDDSINDIDNYAADSVFYISTKDGDCLIQIIAWGKDTNYLKFKWKKIN